MITANKQVGKLFIAGMLMEAGIMYFTMDDQRRLVSVLFVCTFVWIFYFFVRYSYSIKDNSFKQLVVATSIIALVNVILAGGLNGFDYYKKVIMFVCFLLLLYLTSIFSINRRQTKWIVIINFIISLLYIAFYSSAYRMTGEGYMLTLGFSNPNQTGMFVLNSMLYCALPIAAFKDVKVKWFYLAPFGVVLFTISPYLYMTESRGCITAFAVFVILVFLDYISLYSKITSKSVLFIWSIFPLLFAIFYLIDISLFESLDLSFNFEHGKNSTTRVHMWQFAFEKFYENPILGNYYDISYGTGISQMHNMHVDVLASYGIVPFILYVNVLFKSLKKCINKQSSRFNRVALYAFLSCFVSGTFEASLVGGSMGLYILSCGFILLSNADLENETRIQVNKKS